MTPEKAKAMKAHQEKIDKVMEQVHEGTIDPATLMGQYRTEHNRETAKKVARLLAESRTRYDDLSAVFQMAEQFLVISFLDWDGRFSDPV